MTSPDPNDHVTDTFTIANATQVASPSPSPATIKLASNVVTWPITTSGAGTYQSYLLQIASGALLYASYGPSGNIIGTFDPSNNTVSAPATIGGVTELTAIAINAAGNVWIADNQSTINCFNSVANAESGSSPVFSTPVQPLAPSEDTLTIFSIAVDNAGNLWYVGADTGSYQTYAGYFSAALHLTGDQPGRTVHADGRQLRFVRRQQSRCARERERDCL